MRWPDGRSSPGTAWSPAVASTASRGGCRLSRCGSTPTRTGVPIIRTPPAWPRPTTAPRGIVAGLSDRLGWEAVLEFERGAELANAPHAAAERLVVLDGRLGHDVPTVVTLGDGIVRWGAGATWANALERALFGHDAGRPDDAELEVLSSTLRRDGLAVVTVDLGTPVLERAGIFRTSVQLMVATPWDGRGTRVL